MPSASSVPQATAASLSWLPTGVLLGAGGSLVFCVATGPQLFDSGELAAAAVELGGSHPPGQLLHALLAHLFQLLPLGPMPLRFGLLSLVCALLAAFVAGRLYCQICDQLAIATGTLRHVGHAATMLGVLTVLPVLRQTLRIEVYTLALALFLAAVSQAFAWACDARSSRLRAAALFTGLAALVHLPHALAAVLAAACLAAPQLRPLLPSPRVAWSAIAFGLLTQLALSYLPLRAHAGASMWGEPTTLEGFLRYVSGHAFARNLAHENPLELLRDYAAYLLQVSSGVPALGTVLLLKPALEARQRPIGGFLLATALTLVAACLQPLEPRNPDNVAYMAPALALAIIAGAVGFVQLAAQTARLQLVAAAALLCVAVPPASMTHLGEHLGAEVPALESLSSLMLDRPPPRSLVLVSTDFVAASWMMAQSVEGARPDVALFASGLATSSWHWAQLRKHPAFDGKPRTAPGADAYDRYVRGAVLQALPRVAVVLERDLPGVRVGTISGPYTLLDSGLPPTAASVLDGPFVEHSVELIAHEISRGSQGDSDSAASVIRDALCLRAQRLYELGFRREALATLRLALWRLPTQERALVQAPANTLAATRLPTIVDDHDSFLVSAEDALRQAAAMLWASGARDAASTLLQKQFERGDPMALLQLAHLQAFAGRRQDAVRTLTALGSLVGEAQPELVAARELLSR